MTRLTATLVMLPPQTEMTRDWAGELAAAFPTLKVEVAESEAEVARVIGTADAAFGAMPPSLLRQAPRLRWLQAPAVAPPYGYYSQELVDHPVLVTNCRGIYNDYLAAHIVTFILAFARGFHVYLPRQVRGEWLPPEQNAGLIDLAERTLLLIGVGEAGAETARVAAAFGLTVVGVDARRTVAPPGVSELHPAAALDDLLPRADFVVLNIPHTPTTEGLMGRRRFRRMKPSAFFVNVGRGMTARLDDLVAALEAKEIAGAGLDVFEQEPLPAGHPLWSMPGVLLTPHMGGHGPRTEERRFGVLKENCRRFLSGEPLLNQVDKALWF